MHEVRERIEGIADQLAAHADEAEVQGKLPDESVRLLREAGVIRMMQPKEYGGFEAHPAEWFDAAMKVASVCGASGWICGIVGVHPWHMALCHPKVQEEIWGKDPNTWIASPYAPMGKAVATGDGYVLSGRWSFSSGTDHCDWIFLGGVLSDAEGNPLHQPPKSLHFILPRSDYEIVEDSWNVVGLKGTGSKDIIVRNAFIPEYRTIDTFGMREAGNPAGGRSGRTDPLYAMPFSALFGAAITSAVLGTTEGLFAQAVAYQRDRADRMGKRWVDDAVLSFTLGESGSDLDASRVQNIDNLSRMFDLLSKGEQIPYELRVKTRRDQVRSVQRSVDAADKMFTRTGGNAVRADKPLQRLWRDAHAGLHHGINTPQPIYQAASAVAFGLEPPTGGMAI